MKAIFGVYKMTNTMTFEDFDRFVVYFDNPYNGNSEIRHNGYSYGIDADSVDVYGYLNQEEALQALETEKQYIAKDDHALLHVAGVLVECRVKVI